MNLTELDIEFLAQKGISAEEVKDQMVKISKGVNVPNIIRTASIDDGILIFNDSEKENYQTLTFQGTDIRKMLADVSLAHCDKITFPDEQPDMEILHDLYHYRDLRGNTKVNEDKSIGELLKNQHYHYQ